MSNNKHSISIIFISVSLLFYPATVLLIPKINGLIFGLFALMGLILLFAYHKAVIQVNRDESLFYFSFSLFFLVALLITINAGVSYKAVGKYLHLLLVIPIYIYLRHVGVKIMYLWYGLVIGSVVSAGVALYDIHILKLPRARGLTHMIIFGDLSLVMGCMSLAGFGWFKQRARWQMMLPVFALMCGLLSSILSTARGGWVAIPFIIFVFFWYIKSQFSFKAKAIIAVIITAFAIVIYIVPQTNVSYQVDKTIRSLQLYSDSDISSDRRDNSVGSRLEMWQASWGMYLDNPLLGVGWGNYQQQAQLQVDKGLRNQSAASFDHPHNEYFSVLASGGSISFIALMILYLSSAWIFVKKIKSAISVNICRLALAGLVLVVAYMLFGFSEPMLLRSRSVNFFAFYLAIFMAAIYTQENKEVVSSN